MHALSAHLCRLYLKELPTVHSIVMLKLCVNTELPGEACVKKKVNKHGESNYKKKKFTSKPIGSITPMCQLAVLYERYGARKRGPI